jgi:DNA-directed RNA polymerase specialized sigma24 family protein
MAPPTPPPAPQPGSKTPLTAISSDSVTRWINQVKEGDGRAAQHLWEIYFQRMVGLARRKLEGAARAVADEEDVALSAFKSFCMGAQQGRFTQLMDRDNLWALLMAITAHKSVDHIRGQNRQKRGGTGHAPGDSEGSEPRDQSVVPLSEIISREPTPEFAAELSDRLGILLSQLDATGDADLRGIALLKLDGYSTTEIAERLGCVKRTVERKTQLIARIWEKDAYVE